MTTGSTREPVPWRTTWAVIASVVLACVSLLLVVEVARVIVWVLVAGFFAVALSPAVDLLITRAHMRRGLATLVVLALTVVTISGITFVLVRPVVEQGSDVAEELPAFVEDAQQGRGPVGRLVERYGLDERLREQSDRIGEDIGRLGTQSLAVLGTLGSMVAATLTVFVLTFMILLQADKLVAGALAMVPERHREHVSRVAADCARSITGYVTGNLVISVVAGLGTFVVMWLLDVPFPGLLAVWVGITDLIPLVGATLGAVVVVAVAFVASPVAGIVSLVWFVLYQQLENHLLQPAVQSRTVRLNPLTVLVSVLVGVELAGMLGALLAIPVAGVATVILRDVNLGVRPELRRITLGEEKVPAEQAGDPEVFVERRGEDVLTPEDRTDGR